MRNLARITAIFSVSLALSATILTGALGSAAPNRPNPHPQIWFSSGDDLDVKGVVAHPDFMHLFDAPSPWPTGLAQVDVMQLRAPWFLRMPLETGHKVVDFLQQHHIALAVPLGVVSSNTCGQGVEGIGTARQQNVYPREMKKRGVGLQYVVMDLRFVWVEPPQSLTGGPQEMARFLDLYQTRLGEYPVSVRFETRIKVVTTDRARRSDDVDSPSSYGGCARRIMQPAGAAQRQRI